MVSGRLDHGKVALPDCLFYFIVSDAEQFVHCCGGCRAPELLLLCLLLLRAPPGDQGIVFGHLMACTAQALLNVPADKRYSVIEIISTHLTQ